MRLKSRIVTVGRPISLLVLFLSLVSILIGREGWRTAAMFPVDENTVEFTNSETEWWWAKKNGERLGKVKTGNPTTASTSITAGSNRAAKASVVTANGLHTVTMDTLPGRVIINLPDDMRAGDTISGTVVAEPKGSTEEERKNNTAKLSELKLSLGSKFPKHQKELMILITPRVIVQDESTPGGPNQNQANFSTKFPETFNYTIGVNAARTDTETVTITVNSPIWFIRDQATSQRLELPVSPDDFRLPSMGQQGRPLEIFGPFDGDASNTTLMYGPARSTVQDFEKNTENVSGGFGLIRPLAESPRKCVFEAPSTFTGPIQLFVKDAKTNTTSPYRNVGVNLTSPKTNLIKGEHTTLKVEVSGLEGIKSPVPLTLESKGVITMEGGMYQPLMIQPSQVGSDGRYTTTRGITGVRTGGWEGTATVVTQPFNIVLRDPDPPQTVLINSFTGDYVFCGSGPKLSGTGQIKRQGCVITLTDNAPDRQVQGTANACVPVDNGRFFTFYTVGAFTDIKVTVTDTQPPKRRTYFNPLGKPAPPVQDVSAFATCP